ncbi:hypothetical protein [Caudoviricetes sp.]|nr:hypothetical protein [Caudoviricetes sp.]
MLVFIVVANFAEVILLLLDKATTCISHNSLRSAVKV